MKKSLLYFIAGFLCLFTSAQVNAQAIAYVGPRLLITTATPSAIEGTKSFTWSSNPAITGPWGRVIDSIWSAVPLVLVDGTDSIACAAPAFTPGSLTGKWALIWRGDCEFGAKSLKAQTAGAVGVIIINQHPGAAAVNMGAGAVGAGVHIPVLMVSNPDGIALDAMVHGGNQVFVTLTPYGFGNAHDLCIPNELFALPPAGAIPKTQIAAGNGNPQAYKGYVGGWVANTGTSDETNVKLHLDVNWTPTAGSPTLFYKDSVGVAGTFATLDSLDLLNSTTSSYDYHASGTGTFDLTYSTSFSGTDMQPLDNIQKTSMYVTDAAYCRSKYNNVTGQPIVSSGLQLGGTLPPLVMTWGPLFYIDSAADAYNLQMALYAKDTNNHDLSFLSTAGGDFFTVLFKWVDGNSNGVIEPPELTLVGSGNHNFTNHDSDGRVFVAPFDNVVHMTSHTWYWAAAVTTLADLYIGIDGSSNYYNRIFASSHMTTGAWKDFWAPLYAGGVDVDHLTGQADTVDMIPYAADKQLPYKPTDSMSISLGANTPSMALNMQFLQEKVQKTYIKENTFVVFPNPASDRVNVNVEFPTSVPNVSFTIMNASGQVVYNENKGTIKNATVSLPLHGLPSGNYYILMHADGRTTFRPFTINAK